VVVVLAVAGVAAVEVRDARRRSDAAARSCSWPARIERANPAQDGLIRCYLRAIADGSTTGLRSVVPSRDHGGPARFDAAAFAHSADARSGTATPFGAQLSIVGQKAAPEAPLVTTTAEARRVSVTATPSGLISTWEEVAGAAGALNLMGLAMGHDFAPTGTAAILQMAKSSESRPQIVHANGVSTFAWMEAPQGATAPDGGAPDPGISSVARVTGGLMLATNPAQVPLTQPNATVVYPFLATNGNVPAVAYVATYATHTEVRLAIFDADFKIARDVIVRDHPSDASNPSVGWDGTRWAVAWEDLRGGGDESVFASFVSTDGTVVPPFMVASAGSNWPRIASNGTGLSVFTYYLFSGAAQIYASAYDAQNQRVGDPVQISHSSGSRGAKFASVAFDATSGDFGVAWDDARGSDSEIYYARLHCAAK